MFVFCFLFLKKRLAMAIFNFIKIVLKKSQIGKRFFKLADL